MFLADIHCRLSGQLVMEKISIVYIADNNNIIIIILKYQLQHGTKNFTYLTDHILYETFKNIIKKHKTVTDNLAITFSS